MAETLEQRALVRGADRVLDTNLPFHKQYHRFDNGRSAAASFLTAWTAAAAGPAGAS